MKNQKKAWNCFAVYHDTQHLGFVHAYTETQAWGFVRTWALANNYRQQYFNRELSLVLNRGCKNDHKPEKLLGAAKGTKAERVPRRTKEETDKAQRAALRATGEKFDDD